MADKKTVDKVKELLKTDKELAAEIESKLWANIDKLYDRKRPSAKAKVTEVAAAAEPAVDGKKESAKIDVLVDD